MGGVVVKEEDGADGLASGEMLGIMWHEGDEGAQGKRKAVQYHIWTDTGDIYYYLVPCIVHCQTDKYI